MGNCQTKHNYFSLSESKLLLTENYKTCFEAVLTKILDQRKQAKLQCLLDPSEIIWDNQSNI
jgi:hypothetical protein